MLFTFSFLLFSYLLSSIPFGVVLCRLFRDADPRDGGSGNIGATNVYRQFGPRIGLVTLLLDMAKGLLPTWLAVQVMCADWQIGLVALTTVLGHCFSGYLQFRGGRGVATAAGALLAIQPTTTAILIGIWALVTLLTSRTSIAALVAAVLLPILFVAFAPMYLWTALLIAGCVLLRHTDNIRRLLAGKEPPVM